MPAPLEQLPAETLSPLATGVDEVLAVYGYELTPAVDAIDAAVPGFDGLFSPGTTDDERRAAIDEVLAAGLPAEGSAVEAPPSGLVLYVDGSSRGNPGPAGAGAVIQAGETHLARLGRPVGSQTDNNVAEYAALQLGLEVLLARFGPTPVEVRIDSMTVVDAIWGDGSGREKVTGYCDAIDELLSVLPDHEWTHLVDSDPNPADARATVGADVAALGPG